MLEDRKPTRDDTSEVQEPTAENTPPGGVSKLAVWSYVLYNFGNTPFAATVMVLYFPLWLSEQYGAGSALFNFATAIAALLVVLIAPGLGALADLHQRRMPYLVFFTLVVVFLTVGLDFTDELTGSLLVAVVFFVVAVVALAWAPWVLFVAEPLLFLALGATFALGPVLLIALSPSEKLTELMGFFVMVGNVATVLGPAIVALILVVFGGLGTGSYRIAMSSFAVAMVLGIFLLLRIPDARTTDSST